MAARQAGMRIGICNPDDSLRDAARRLLEEDCGSLLVRAAAARVEDPGRSRPLALLDDQGQLLALVSLAQLGARVGASLAGEGTSG